MLKGIGTGRTKLNNPSSNVVLFQSNFNQPDNASTLPDFLTSQGTYGTQSNRAYNVTDTNGDMAYKMLSTANYKLSCTLYGQISSATNFRIPAVMFNYIDKDNLMFVRPRGGVLELYKIILGVATLIASPAVATPDSTEMPISVESRNNNITIIYNGITLNYLNIDALFTSAMGIGFRLSKGGSPTVNAYWDNLVVQA